MAGVGRPDAERGEREAERVGLDVVDLRYEELPMIFHDVGAVVYFLRLVVWIVPDFTVDQYRDRLAPARCDAVPRDLDALLIEAVGRERP